MIREIIGNILIFFGVVFAVIGLLGVLRFKDFYSKLLASSKIDTMAMLTLLAGVIIRSGLTFFSLKAALIVFIVIIVNPIVTSRIALSAREDELNKNKERVIYHD